VCRKHAWIRSDEGQCVVEVSDSRLLAETENCLPVLVSDMPPSAYEVLGGDDWNKRINM
jgi:hypothetical protein